MDITIKMLSAISYALYQSWSSGIVITGSDAIEESWEDMIECIESILEVCPDPDKAYWYDATLVKAVKEALAKEMICPECGQILPAVQTKCYCTEHGVYLIELPKK